MSEFGSQRPREKDKCIINVQIFKPIFSNGLVVFDRINSPIECRISSGNLNNHKLGDFGDGRAARWVRTEFI
jgi:hypothetical protein